MDDGFVAREGRQRRRPVLLDKTGEVAAAVDAAAVVEHADRVMTVEFP